MLQILKKMPQVMSEKSEDGRPSSSAGSEIGPEYYQGNDEGWMSPAKVPFAFFLAAKLTRKKKSATLN